MTILLLLALSIAVRLPPLRARLPISSSSSSIVRQIWQGKGRILGHIIGPDRLGFAMLRRALTRPVNEDFLRQVLELGQLQCRATDLRIQAGNVKADDASG